MKEIEVTGVGAVPEGEARGFNVEGEGIALCNVAGEIYALQGVCTHQELPLDGGAPITSTSCSVPGGWSG